MSPSNPDMILSSHGIEGIPAQKLGHPVTLVKATAAFTSPSHYSPTREIT